jgi:queuosine biosynthesis protein QueD
MGKFLVTKTIKFEAAHRLESLPAEHQCSRPHGHSYKIEITLTAKTLDQHGMVLDFDVLKRFVMQLDHQDLNGFVSPSTAERLAQFIWDGLEHVVLGEMNRDTPIDKQVHIHAVTVWETENNKVTFLGAAT